MPGTQDPQVVIIDIDERSLRREGRLAVAARQAGAVRRRAARPLRRARGRVRRRVPRNRHVGRQRGARASSRTPSSRAPRIRRDGREASHRTRFRRAVRGRDARAARGAGLHVHAGRAARGMLPAPAFTGAALGGHDIPIAEEHGYAANLEVLQHAAATAGHLDPVFDSDNVVRRVPLVKRYEGSFYPALAWRSRRPSSKARRSSRISTATATSIRSTSPGSSCRSRATARRSSPIADRRRASAITRRPTCSRDGPADEFTGAIVLVGTTAKGLAGSALDAARPRFSRRRDAREPPRRHAERGNEIGSGGDAADRGADHPGRGMLVVFAVPWRRPLLGRARHRGGGGARDRRATCGSGGTTTLSSRSRRRS